MPKHESEIMSNNFWDVKLEEAEEEPPVKQSIFPQEPLQPKEAAVNPTMETSNRLIEMEKIDVAKLDEDYSRLPIISQTYH